MGKGIDTPMNCCAAAKKIKEAGYDFVGRYYNRNRPQKNLTREEAIALSQAELNIVAIWENGFPTHAAYFNYEVGKQDGTDAVAYARKIVGQPDGTPIYFTVDYDASDTDLSGPVNAYMKGVVDSVVASKGEDGPYEVGIYGSGMTCERMMEAFPSIKHAWLSESTGWRGYSKFSNWSIKQLQTTTLCGLNVDMNLSNGAAGGFRVTVRG